MRVAAWQAPVEPHDGAGRRAALTAAVQAAEAAGADLLVAPEFALTGPPAAGAAGIASDAAEARALGELARASGIAIAAGYIEACTGRLYSAALLVEADGRAVANYRRSHLRREEAERLARGAWLSLMPVGARRVGLMIGYDLHFPEVARALVLAGADLLLVLGSQPGEPEALIGPLAAARAIENGVPLVLATWCGAGAAAARILGPEGEILALAGAGPATIVAEAPQQRRRAAGLADRRPGLYHQLVADEP